MPTTKFESYPLLPPELSSNILSFLLPEPGEIGEATPSLIRDLVVSSACLRRVCKSFNRRAIVLQESPDAWHNTVFLDRRRHAAGPGIPARAAVRGRLLVTSLPALCKAPSCVLLPISALVLQVLEAPRLRHDVLAAVPNVVGFVFRLLDDTSDLQLCLAAMALCQACIRVRGTEQLVYSALVQPLVPRFKTWMLSTDSGRERFHQPAVDGFPPAAEPWLLPAGSMRKAAAELLTAIAENWNVVPLILPQIFRGVLGEEGGRVDDWDREVAMLMLGVIARPSGHSLELYGQTLLPRLQSLAVSEPEPMLRCTAFWALGRMLQGLHAYDSALLPPSVLRDEAAASFLTGMRHDPHPKVKAAAASALADLLQPLQPSVVRQVLEWLVEECFDVMGADPQLPGPYGVLAELVHHAPPADRPALLFPRLLAAWKEMDRSAIGQSYVAEVVLVLLALCTAAQLPEAQYVLPLLDLCRETVEANLPLATLQQERILDAALSVVVSCDDILSEGRLLQVAPWLGANMLPIVTAAHREPNLSVSAYALLGEALRVQPEPFVSTLADWMPQAAASLDGPWEAPTRSNNAAWTCGVAAIYASEGALAAYVPQLVDRLVSIIMRQEPPLPSRPSYHSQGLPSRGRAADDELYLQFTTACTLGALAVNCTADVSTRLPMLHRGANEGDHLPGLWSRWADLLVRGHAELRDDMHSEEQVHAVLGFVLVMSQDVTCLLLGNKPPPAPTASLLQQYLLVVSTIIGDTAWVEGEERSRSACQRAMVVCRDTLERLRSYVRCTGQQGSVPSWSTLMDGLDRALVLNLRPKLGI